MRSPALSVFDPAGDSLVDTDLIGVDWVAAEVALVVRFAHVWNIAHTSGDCVRFTLCNTETNKLGSVTKFTLD